MRVNSKILELKYKLMTIEMLNLAKSYYTYRELSQLIELARACATEFTHFPSSFKISYTEDATHRIDGTLHQND